MNLSLKGKYALVCGSSQGIGFAIAQELSLLGANCVLLARNEASLQQAVQKLDSSLGQEHGYLVADFANRTRLKEIISEFMQARRIHVLVNNTGGPPAGPAYEAKEEDFIAAFNQHLVCNHILTTAVVPSMKAEGYGRIINIISTSVRIPLKNLGVSNTIRGAVASWAKTMANELGRFQITVNNLLPGNITTQRLSSIIETTAKKNNVSPTETEAKMKDEIPLGRFGMPSEIGALAAFLASPAGSYISGVSIPVDGGKTGSI